MEEDIKNIIEATSMGRLEKEVVIESLLNLHRVINCFALKDMESGNLLDTYKTQSEADKGLLIWREQVGGYYTIVPHEIPRV
tara:strand:+ start:66 stop:311 length:246 start_codon:yes stop_codon:yes gene_type:complete